MELSNAIATFIDPSQVLALRPCLRVLVMALTEERVADIFFRPRESSLSGAILAEQTHDMFPKSSLKLLVLRQGRHSMLTLPSVPPGATRTTQSLHSGSH